MSNFASPPNSLRLSPRDPLAAIYCGVVAICNRILLSGYSIPECYPPGKMARNKSASPATDP